jgi:hypothetical protein
MVVVEQLGGEIGRDPIILSKELEMLGSNVKEATEEQLYQGSKVGKEKYLAMALIRASDRSRYGRLMEDLKTQFLNRYNTYPVNVTAKYHPLTHYVVSPQTTARIVNDSEGVAFATVDVTKEKRDITKIKCYRCNKKGHFANHCPENESDAKAPTLPRSPRRRYNNWFLLSPPMDTMPMMTFTTSISYSRVTTSIQTVSYWTLDPPATSSATGSW